MPQKYQRKRQFQNNNNKKKLYRKNATKKLVTGRDPTLVEQIASGVGSVAKLATAVAPMLMAINTEQKYLDFTASVTAHTPGTNDQIILLTDSVQGLTDSNRVGNSILAKDLQLRLACNFTPQTGPPLILGLHCRFMLICWKENAQVNAPTAAKIFEVASNLYSPVNKDNSDQFVVLKDKFFTMNAQTQPVTSGSQGFMQFKIFKKLDWHMRYNGAAAAANTQGHIYLILRSSTTNSAAALSTTYYSRLNFTDN